MGPHETAWNSGSPSVGGHSQIRTLVNWYGRLATLWGEMEIVDSWFLQVFSKRITF